MAIAEIFSKRQKKLKGEVPDVFIYDNIPRKLKVQIIHIINDAFGIDRRAYITPSSDAFAFIHNSLCREYGVFRLIDEEISSRDLVLKFLMQTNKTDECLDVIEICFKTIDNFIRDNNNYSYNAEPKIIADEAITELNERFKENGIGFCFESGQIIKMDSLLAHNEITKPTLKLLWNETFKNANEEYLKAHEHYRHGRKKECLNECLKAFESTMKIICNHKGWNFNSKDTSKKLIQICLDNNLVPKYLQNQFTSLQNL